jgi:hypothetical protein
MHREPHRDVGLDIPDAAHAWGPTRASKCLNLHAYMRGAPRMHPSVLTYYYLRPLSTSAGEQVG